MADSKTKRIRPGDLQENIDAFSGLKGLAGYNPANADYSEANGTTAQNVMTAAQEKEVQDYGTWQASRDGAVAAEWAFHDYVRNMRIQVKAQFGENSDQLQAVGHKKKSEYKNPTKKTTS